ncbi:MAG: hypothetical protein WCA39_12660, partial [Nitrososphaeraceae archaeon]
EKHLILTKKDKLNSQIYRLFTSSENLVSESLNNLHQMKEALLNLLTTIQENHIKMEAARKMFFKERQLFTYRDLPLEAYILIFYRHIVGLFLNYSLFEWPEKIKDQEMLKMLYGEFLSIIQEIQRKIVNILNAIDSVENSKRNYEALRGYFGLDAEHLDIIFEAYQHMGLGRQVEPVLDSLWKISLPFIPSVPFDEGLSEAEKSGDWRKIVKEWKSIKQKSPPRFKIMF